MIHSTPTSHNASVIDLDGKTVEQLESHRVREDEERAEWRDDYEGHSLVVAKENGETIHPHTFSQSFERLLERANLRRIRLHDLRHTHATLASRPASPSR